MYEDTVTVFNRRKLSRSAFKWVPTVLKGVEVQQSKGINKTTSGTADADEVKVFVRCSPEGLVGKKLYYPPKEYAGLVDYSRAFTLLGDGADFLCLGEWDGGEVIEADYVNGFYEHMKATHDYVWKITTVDIFKTIPHFEIGGA